MTKRGRKQLRAEQFNRACDLRRYIELKCANGLPGRLADTAVYATADWLKREYRLGRDSAKREQRSR